jgi:hypothetical protein
MSELDKTIEELEAEVLAELEEADASNDPQKKGAAPAQTGEKVDDKVSGAVQDTGAPVVKPDQADAPAKKVAAAAKQVSGDPQQKTAKEEPKKKQGSSGEATPGETQKLAAGDQVETEEDQEDLNELKKEMADMKDKKEILKAMHDKMEIMKVDELKALAAQVMQDEEEDEEDAQAATDEEKKEAVEARIQEIDVSEDVEALMGSEDSLSEEFKEKASTIFEAAVKSKIRPEVERIENEVSDEYNQKLTSFKEEMTDKVDTYLNYVVEEWTKENELAIERGLKGEIAEDFISGLKQLFEDHYIDVPDEKYDILEAQSEKIAELEEKLNEAIDKNVKAKDENSKLVREQVIAEVSADLADTEFEKFKSLTQDVEFTDEESFTEKLDTLKESYFPKTTTTKTFGDEDGGTAQDIDTTEAMSAYMSAISRNKARAQ